MSLQEDALQWWTNITGLDRYVVLSQELPDWRRRDYLVGRGMLFKAAAGVWVAKRPEDTETSVVAVLYWRIVSKLLERYGEWSIRSASAVRLYVGVETPPARLLVRTRVGTNRTIRLISGQSIYLMSDEAFDGALVHSMNVAGVDVRVDVPERVALERWSGLDQLEMPAFISGTHFDALVFEALYARRPQPVAFERIAAASQIARPDLAAVLRAIARPRGPGDADLSRPHVAQRPAWVLRQDAQVARYAQEIQTVLGDAIRALPRVPVSDRVSEAREHMRYDTYHSTTLEGYDITHDDVSVLLGGGTSKGRETVDNLRNRMAIIGYGAAFDRALQECVSQGEKATVSETLIRGIYAQLFRPSVDAKIVDPLELVGYRQVPAYIRGTQYVPPGATKVRDLMSAYCASLAIVPDPVIRAILAHFVFVTIHPYTDGNGRTARLLMDVLLVGNGYRWVTVPSDRRDTYFAALWAGQVNEDIEPFARFVYDLLAAGT
ncbi:MAG: Fic family protein [Coriobacteriia bacterium]